MKIEFCILYIKDILDVISIYFSYVNKVMEHLKTHDKCVIPTFYGYSKNLPYKSCPVGHKKTYKSLFLLKIERIFAHQNTNYLRSCL